VNPFKDKINLKPFRPDWYLKFKLQRIGRLNEESTTEINEKAEDI
jgi:hypothetical protein